MKKIFVFTCIITSLCTAITACNKQSSAPAEYTKTVVLPAQGSSVVNASNVFAFNFLHAACKQDTADNNKLISPLSIYLALSMAYNGAGNATKDSIAKTLQLDGIDINDLNAVCNSLITQLPQEDNKVQFSIANSIWYNQNNYQPLPSFLTTVQNTYDATMQSLDFSNPSSVNTINNWVAQKTNNKIPNAISNISSGDLMYLINAIYFNGSWRTSFPVSGTHNDVFTLESGGKKTVPFMTNQLATNFYADSLLTLIELPYGGGNSYSMYIALPRNPQPISSFVSSIDAAVLENAIGKMDSVPVNVSIPKWEYGYDIENMHPELALLGMDNAFTENADFSNMYNASEVKPYITTAIHKTYIKVNEEGTEAAAVTVIGSGVTDVLPYSSFKADRPFLYTIIEKQTGIILFTGIIAAPAGND